MGFSGVWLVVANFVMTTGTLQANLLIAQNGATVVQSASRENGTGVIYMTLTAAVSCNANDVTTMRASHNGTTDQAVVNGSQYTRLSVTLLG